MGIRGEIFSTKLLLENRSYFFNVKENRLGDLYLNVVESKNRDSGGFERQSVIVFSADLPAFLGEFDKALKVLEKSVREQKRSGSGRRPPRSFDEGRDDEEGRRGAPDRDDEAGRGGRYDVPNKAGGGYGRRPDAPNRDGDTGRSRYYNASNRNDGRPGGSGRSGDTRRGGGSGAGYKGGNTGYGGRPGGGRDDEGKRGGRPNGGRRVVIKKRPKPRDE